MREEDMDFNPHYDFAKGGKTKKFPVAVKRRIDEINEMLPKVNESGDYASTYAGSTMESYIILDKPIQIKGNYVYISEEDSSWGNYGFEKRYNVNDTRDTYESINGRKALMSDLGIIKRAFTKLLKSEGKMAKGGKTKIKNMSKYKKGGWIQEATKEMEEDGTEGAFTKQAKRAGMSTTAFAKKVLKNPKKFTETTRKRALFMKNTNPKKFDVGGEIVRAYDENVNSGVGTYARGGKISKDDAIVKALKMGVDFNKDFHAQSFGNELTQLAKETGYRKSKSSSGSTGRAFFEHLERRYDKNPSYYDKMAKQMARGGKMQGYNAQLDESLGMRKGAKRTKQQSDKDRRDEAKAMNKAMGRRAYASVRGMDKGRRKMAKGGKITIKDIEKSWDKNYGEDFKEEYSGLYNKLKKEKNLSAQKLDKLWDETYGEDFKEEYGGVYEELNNYAKGGELSKSVSTIYSIYYVDSDGSKYLEAITNSPEKWLEEHNKDREADGNDEEYLDDFKIEQSNYLHFGEKFAKGGWHKDRKYISDEKHEKAYAPKRKTAGKKYKKAQGGNIMQDISPNANTGDGDIMPDASSMVDYAKGGEVGGNYDGGYDVVVYNRDGSQDVLEGGLSYSEAMKLLKSVKHKINQYEEIAIVITDQSQYFEGDTIRYITSFAKGGWHRDRKFASKEEHEKAYAPKRKKPFKRYKGRK